MLLFGALVAIFDEDGDSRVSDVASASIIDNVDIEQAANADEGYYFKIDKDIINKYLIEVNRAYHYGYWHDIEPDTDKEEFIYDAEELDIDEDDIAEWFKTKDYEPYLVKMIRAEIASSYPKMGEYDGGSEDRLGNKKDRERKLCGTRNCRDTKNINE